MNWIKHNKVEFGITSFLLVVMSLLILSITTGPPVESGAGNASCEIFTEKPKILKCSDNWTLVFVNVKTGHIAAVR